MTEYGRIHTDGSRSGGQPTHSNIFEACDVQKHTLIVDQDYASHTVKVKSLDDSQPTQSDAEITEADRDAAAQYDVVEAFARHRKYGYDQGYYDGRKMDAMEERAAIVAYARGHGGNAWSRDVLYFAEKIEAGEHLK